MGLQVTASKTGLLLECVRPFASDTPIEETDASEAMRYGSAFHEVLEHTAQADTGVIAAKWGSDIDPKELKEHAGRTMRFLADWIAGDNVFGETFTILGKETHRATRVPPADAGGAATRICEFDAETHTYDLRPGEFGGTDDITVANTARKVVIDYKTGDWGEFHKPEKLPQMLTLAIQTTADHVGILHSPRAGVPVMFIGDTPYQVLAAHAKRLRGAMRRIGNGTLRPHAGCARCPALEGCPAQDGALLKQANALIKVAVTKDEMARPVNKGEFHMFLQALDKLSKRAKEVLREDIRAGEVIVRPDGLVLALRSKTRENLSKSTIVAALGKQRGERLIEGLRKKGCTSESSWDEVHAVKE